MRRKTTKSIARERIEILMQRAEKIFHEDKERADRYAHLARKIAMRCTLRFPRKWKRRICKNCKSFLVPGANCRVRLYRSTVFITCLECGKSYKYPYKREKKIKRRLKA
jgi:ribonuclease P protein subunit RPR2